MQRPGTDILQIVPTLAESSGVGSYALHLAATLRQDHRMETRFVVGRDEEQPPGGVDGFRASAIERSAAALASAIDAAGTAAISIVLHYVGYGYQARGVPFWLADGLRRWRTSAPGGRLLTVFHELYATSPFPWQSSFWLSPVQQHLACQMARLSDAALTPVQRYAEQLVSCNPRLRGHYKTLPIFSNVGEPANVPAPAARESILVVFAGPGAAQQLYSRYEALLLQAIQRLGVSRIIDIGPRIDAPPARLADRPVVVQGVLPEADVSALLCKCRYGVLRYPLRVAGKSGVLAAYSAHGVVPIFMGAGRPEDGSFDAGGRFLVAEQIDRSLSDEDLASLALRARDWYRTHSTGIHAKEVADSITGVSRQLPGGPA